MTCLVAGRVDGTGRGACLQYSEVGSALVLGYRGRVGLASEVV